MSQSKKWDEWSGFTGEGTYDILNKSSLTCLDLEKGSKKVDTKIQGFAHSPNSWAQLWKIRKRDVADLYYIECLASRTVLTASGPDKPVVGVPKVANKEPYGENFDIPKEALWVIDKSIYALEPGKMVVFRNLKYPGYVLDLHHGEKTDGTANATPVNIMPERGVSDKREMQKWLLQIQPS
ncbi:MAG: hypothetical protein Q9169_007800 [Polycauliona sp. 2 TL-2023]